MKVFCEEGLANCFGPRRRCDEGNDITLSVGSGGNVGQLSSSEILTSACRPCPDKGKATWYRPLFGEVGADAAESVNLGMRGNSKRENREIPSVCGQVAQSVEGTAQRESFR